MKTGIYMIKNNVNGKVYVGQSRNIERRWDKHIRELNEGKHHNRFLQYDYKNQGSSCLSFEIIEEVEVNKNINGWKYLQRSVLYALENWYVNKLEGMNYNLYNVDYAYKRELSRTSLKDLIAYCQENIYRNDGRFIYDNGVTQLIDEVEERLAKRREEREDKPKAERKPRTPRTKKVKEQPVMAFGMSLDQARELRR